MTNLNSRSVSQPYVGIGAAALVSILFASTWTQLAPEMQGVGFSRLFGLMFFLSTTVVLAGLYPIHLRHATKVTMTTVPLFLISVLLPPTFAALTAGSSIFIQRYARRTKLYLLPSDMITAACRWTIVTWLASQVAHLPLSGYYLNPTLLLAAAIVMFLGDILTGSLEVAPMTGEPVFTVLTAIAREAFLVECLLYLVGILGALAALYQVWSLVLLLLPTGIVYFVFKSLIEMQESTRNVLESMADAVDLRDPYTGGHSRRIAEMCQIVLREMGVVGREADLIRVAARVHDIGKVEIPDQILSKPGALNDAEWAIIKLHPGRGADILARYPGFGRGAEIVRYHHERWDGQGYPRGLKGLDIPLGARVIAVADAFDAMTVDRPYRRAFAPDHAILVLRAGAGRQWDPSVVDSFLKIVARKGQKVEQAIVPNAAQSASATK